MPMMMMQSTTIPAISGTLCFIDEAAASADGETVNETVSEGEDVVGGKTDESTLWDM